MSRRVEVVERVLGANDRLAAANRDRLDRAGVHAVNLMASPGAGKTSVILQTISGLKNKIKTLRKEKAEGRKSKSRKETNRLRRKIKELKRQSRKFGQEKAEVIAAAKKVGKEAAPAAAAPAPAPPPPPAPETASADAPKVE